MRKKIIAGNWKMNTNLQDGIKLAGDLCSVLSETISEDVRVIVAPPFLHLTEVVKVVRNTKVEVSAQNCSYEEQGAYTGEVSAGMLKSAGVSYVIIGHSERRAYFNETDYDLLKKVNQVLHNDMTPIFCCGEVLEEREAGNHFEVVKQQLENGLFSLGSDLFKRVVVAYEPVWAIGTGKTASPQQAQEMHYYIRSLISQKYGEETAQNTSILYGGSCKPSNAKELFENPDVDGGLIGGASLKAEDFIGIITSF